MDIKPTFPMETLRAFSATGDQWPSHQKWYSTSKQGMKHCKWAEVDQQVILFQLTIVPFTYPHKCNKLGVGQAPRLCSNSWCTQMLTPPKHILPRSISCLSFPKLHNTSTVKTLSASSGMKHPSANLPSWPSHHAESGQTFIKQIIRSIQRH